jgi:hypothetical protein
MLKYILIMQAGIQNHNEKGIVLFGVQSFFVKKSLQEKPRKLTYVYYNFCSFTTKERKKLL